MDGGNRTAEILQTFLRIKAIKKKEKSVYERVDLNHLHVTRKSKLVLQLTYISQKQYLPLLDNFVNAGCALERDGGMLF